MNRDIKFRAINAKNKIIYGLPYTDTKNKTSYYDEYNNRLCWRNDEGASTNQPYKNGTLMQFTGLQDKNGKDIYEGDIVSVKGKDDEQATPYNVEFRRGQWVACNNLYDDINYNDLEVEITGNIFEPITT